MNGWDDSKLDNAQHGSLWFSFVVYTLLVWRGSFFPPFYSSLLETIFWVFFFFLFICSSSFYFFFLFSSLYDNIKAWPGWGGRMMRTSEGKRIYPFHHHHHWATKNE